MRDADFPFLGYDDVLDAVVRCAGVTPGMAVLDLGTGTGSLIERLLSTPVGMKPDIDLWGADFSEEMLVRARARIQGVRFVKMDLLAPCWPAELARSFDRIVSAYVFHEFDLETKLSLLRRLVHDHLAPGGRIVIGDIAFPTAEMRAAAHQRWETWWDEDEAYWAADETTAALSSLGLDVAYTQVSACAGVFTLARRHESATIRPTLRAPSQPRRGPLPRRHRAHRPAHVGRSAPASGAHRGPRTPRSPGALR